MELEVGRPVEVHTRDRHVYPGVLLEIRQLRDGRTVGLVRLDSGWVTAYPVEMLVQTCAPSRHVE